MIETIYVEQAVADHPRTKRILERFSRAHRVDCHHYGEIFNRSAQNFRLQKRRPALILARKQNKCVQLAPEGYGIGSEQNYYFSHMLNCIYDCRYCFLQGMFRSAHYLLFVNFEDFGDAIRQQVASVKGYQPYFFSGYDSDSLATDDITQFVDYVLPVFADLPNAWLELRTKSVNTRSLLQHEPLSNVVVAFSFTPEAIGRALENGVPPITSRLQKMAELQQRNWKLGLRLDPVIYHPDYQQQYNDLIAQISNAVDMTRLHSVSVGPFRLPRDYFHTMLNLYPDQPLFSGPLTTEGKMVSYPPDLEQTMHQYCMTLLRQYVSPEQLFACRP